LEIERYGFKTWSHTAAGLIVLYLHGFYFNINVIYNSEWCNIKPVIFIREIVGSILGWLPYILIEVLPAHRQSPSF